MIRSIPRLTRRRADHDTPTHPVPTTPGTVRLGELAMSLPRIRLPFSSTSGTRRFVPGGV